MEIEILDRDPRVTWIRLSGRLDLEGVERIQDRVLALTVSGRPLVADLSAVPFVGSLGIAMWFQAARALRLRRATLVLLSPTAPIERALATSGLFEVASLAPSEADAFAAAGLSRGPESAG